MIPKLRPPRAATALQRRCTVVHGASTHSNCVSHRGWGGAGRGPSRGCAGDDCYRCQLGAPPHATPGPPTTPTVFTAPPLIGRVILGRVVGPVMKSALWLAREADWKGHAQGDTPGVGTWTERGYTAKFSILTQSKE